MEVSAPTCLIVCPLCFLGGLVDAVAGGGGLITLPAVFSLAAGAYDGFYGPGAGTFLLLLYSAVVGLDVRGANGASKMVSTSSNLAGFAVFILSGQALVALGLVAGLFNMAGQWLGAGLAMEKGGRVVRPMIIIVLAMLLAKVAMGQ